MNMVRAHKSGGRSGKALWRSAKTKSTAVVRLSKGFEGTPTVAAGAVTPPLAPVAARVGTGAGQPQRSKTPDAFYLTHGERLAGVEADVVELKSEVGALRSDVQAMRDELSSLVSGLKVLCRGLNGPSPG